jgi:hypothetical protein
MLLRVLATGLVVTLLSWPPHSLAEPPPSAASGDAKALAADAPASCATKPTKKQEKVLKADRDLVRRITASYAEARTKEGKRMRVDAPVVVEAVVTRAGDDSVLEVCQVLSGKFAGKTIDAKAADLSALELPLTAGSRMLLQLDQDGKVLGAAADDAKGMRAQEPEQETTRDEKGVESVVAKEVRAGVAEEAR